MIMNSAGEEARCCSCVWHWIQWAALCLGSLKEWSSAYILTNLSQLPRVMAWISWSSPLQGFSFMRTKSLQSPEFIFIQLENPGVNKLISQVPSANLGRLCTSMHSKDFAWVIISFVKLLSWQGRVDAMLGGNWRFSWSPTCKAKHVQHIKLAALLFDHTRPEINQSLDPY